MKTKNASVRRTLSLDAETDRLLVEATEVTGNISETVRHAIHAVYDAGIYGGDRDVVSKHINRATAYMKAKQAGMAFDAHIGDLVRQLRPDVVAGKQFNAGGSVFCSDYWVPSETKPIAIVCKSHVSEDSLLLALGECLVGVPRVGPKAEIWVLIPYATQESERVRISFKGISRVRMYQICELKEALKAA
jgi:hypothetical protein